MVELEYHAQQGVIFNILPIVEYNLKKKKLNHFAVHLKLTQCCKSIILQLKTIFSLYIAIFSKYPKLCGFYFDNYKKLLKYKINLKKKNTMHIF